MKWCAFVFGIVILNDYKKKIKSILDKVIVSMKINIKVENFQNFDLERLQN